MNAAPDSLRLLMTYYFEQSKIFALIAILGSLSIYAAGLVGLRRQDWQGRITTLIIALTAAFGFLAWLSERDRMSAETLYRHYQYVDGLGHAVSQDLWTSYEEGVSRNSLESMRDLSIGWQFSSTLPKGYYRLLENTGEAAWWDAKIARVAGWICLAVFAVGLFVAIICMLAILNRVRHPEGNSPHPVQYPYYGTLLSGFVLFVLSSGALPTWYAYSSFAEEAEKLEQRARDLVHECNQDASEIYAVVGEYQVARVRAPIMPTFIWEFKRDQLNQLWNIRSEGYHKRCDA
jgi:hypothetical protein